MTQELATSEQTHRCPEPELWINSKWRRPRNANDRSKMTEMERWDMDSKLDTTRLDLTLQNSCPWRNGLVFPHWQLWPSLTETQTGQKKIIIMKNAWILIWKPEVKETHTSRCLQPNRSPQRFLKHSRLQGRTHWLTSRTLRTSRSRDARLLARLCLEEPRNGPRTPPTFNDFRKRESWREEGDPETGRPSRGGRITLKTTLARGWPSGVTLYPPRTHARSAGEARDAAQRTFLAHDSQRFTRSQELKWVLF